MARDVGGRTAWRVTLGALSTLALPAIALGAAPSDLTRPALPLSEVLERVQGMHPQLKRLDYSAAGLAAQLEIARQAPATTLGAQAENVAGTGEARTARTAEFTVTLASVLERGGKRDARVAIAESQTEALASVRDATRIDLMAEAARRYIDVAVDVAMERLAAEDGEQRRRVVDAADRRLREGASPKAVVLTARAALTRATLDQARSTIDADMAYRRLATLWGEPAEPRRAIEGEVLVLPEIPSLEVLTRAIEASPAIQRFATEDRIREARLRLAQTEAKSDVTWQVGVRRIQDSHDWGLVGSISVPLGSAARAAPSIRAADAELSALSVDREAEQLRLIATLAEAYGQYTANREEALQEQRVLLPELVEALDASRQAYTAGALSYLEWSNTQEQWMTARKQQLRAAADAQRALIEIQRLTGLPTVATLPSNLKSSP